MKAITTKYLGATSTKPSRIKASAEGVKSRTWTVGELQDEQAASKAEWHRDVNLHGYAALKLAKNNAWSTDLASGGTANPDIWVHCFIQKEDWVRRDTLKR